MKMVVVLAALATASSACAPVDYCEGSTSEIGAYLMSREFVKRKLRSPASAQFPDFNAPGVHVMKEARCKFSVVAYVDAQNAFGAPLRTAYVSVLTVDRDGRYTDEGVVLNE